MDEQLEVLVPPYFLQSGVVKTRADAIRDRDWIPIFNLWIVTNTPVPSVIYQQRGPDRSWGANLLDVAAGGHYQVGETKLDGLREVKEELGKQYDPASLTYMGRKMGVGEITPLGQRNNILELYMTADNGPLSSYKLDPREVYALCSCPIAELQKVHREEGYSFPVEAMRHDGQLFTLLVTKDSFPKNWDEYHYKIALLAERYLQGERNLVY